MRRSARSSTVAASRPASWPAFHLADEIRPALDAEPLQHPGIGIERVAREEEADGVELALEALRQRPARHLGQRQRLDGVGTEQCALALRTLVGAARGDGEDRFDAGVDAGAIRIEKRRRHRRRPSFPARACWRRAG